LVTSAWAADNVRDVQTKLKDGGFYFGPVDGALSSDLSAAVTRYQIRHGLQITGNLNPETSKALGVKPEVTSAVEAPPAAGAETWRQLRKPNQQFFDRAHQAGARSPAPTSPSVRTESASSAPTSDSPTAALVPAEPGDNSTFVLSPERLRDYIGAFVLAGLDPRVGSELEFFADRVRYFDDGVVDREKIRGDLHRYDAKWPRRRFWLAGDLNVEPQPDSRLRVSFPLRFDLRNGSKHSSGQVEKSLLLEVRGEDLQIVAVNERRSR
ncbi:MAG: peptidoglycan-binding protein, partial [Verrucomicrobiota bacterium]|nr:peptidoglycan-binding protein [Verrucomicrobiota bacterium]